MEPEHSDTGSQDSDSNKTSSKGSVKGEKKEDNLVPGDQLPASSITDGNSPQPTSKKSRSLSTTNSSFFNPAATHQSAETTLQTSSDKPPYGAKNKENLRKGKESMSGEDTSDDSLDGEESTTSEGEKKPIKKTSVTATVRVSSLDTFQHRKPRKIKRTGVYQPKGTKKMRTPAEQKELEKKNSKTGELGEQIVYTHLEKKYRRDYETQLGYQYCETSQGFELQQETEDCCHLIKIIWLNGKRTEKNGMEYEESGKPADFKIIDIKKDNKTGETKEKKIYIEVKATEKNKPAALNYSKNEWYRMFKYMPKENTLADTTTRAVDYHLYRVYNVYENYEDTWSIKIMENPGKKILQSTQEQNLGDNKFIVESIQFKL